jgi:D-glycerate 3-kinase
MNMVHERLAATLVGWAGEHGPGLLVGLAGAQGSGKSTLTAALQSRLAEAGLGVAVLSIDDVYLTRAEREALAQRVHPLLRTRGPPGTHDVVLAERVLGGLRRPGATALPRFDKARDDRRPPDQWDAADGPVDVIVLEGWCVGVGPQPESALAEPVNTLERVQDAAGTWRRWVNAALAGSYQRLFARLDRLVVLQAPSFDVVLGWRLEQERALRARLDATGEPGRTMTDAEVQAFVAHYERLTRHALTDLPPRADVVIGLTQDRTPTWLKG